MSDLGAMVDECPYAAGIVDLDDLCYVTTNDAVAEMFDLGSRPDGEEVLRFVQDPSVARRLQVLRGTGIRSFETRWELRTAAGVPFVRPGWAVSLGGHSNLVLAVAGPDGLRGEAELSHRAAMALTVAVLDDEWRIQRVSEDIEALLGWRADQWRGRPLLGEMHPADVARFCGAMFRGSDQVGGTSFEARLRDRSGSWRRLTLGVISEGSTGELPSAVVTLSPSTSGETSLSKGRSYDWAVLSSGPEDAGGALRDLLAERVPTVELSPRQLEIVHRLLRGERVRTVAVGLHLSQSTVRSHLSGLFQKFGVSSQEELIRRLRTSLDDPSS